MKYSCPLPHLNREQQHTCSLTVPITLPSHPRHNSPMSTRSCVCSLATAQIFRHADLAVATQAADTLVVCSRSGPGMLQPIARLALTSAVSKAAQGLSVAVRAALKLPSAQLQAQAEELESAGVGVGVGVWVWVCE